MLNSTLPRACELAWDRLDGVGRSLPYTLDRIATPLQLSTLRRICGLSQRELADLLGTTTTTVSRLERSGAVIDTRWSSHLTLLFAHLTKGVAK